jgi:ribosomal protein L37AE/L43A
MKTPSRKTSKLRHIICPFCKSGHLVAVGPGFTRCGSCRWPLLGSALETLRDIVRLPDALGSHPCECGHPEMRCLPGGVYHCPACGSEVLPIETPLDPKRTRLGSASAWGEGAVPHPDARTSLHIDSEGR